MRNVLIGLLLCLLVIGGASCGRKSNPSKSDTTYTKKADTLGLKPKDPEAPKKVEKEIETIFIKVEKDCPEIPKDTIIKWKTGLKEKCTHESLSGGILSAKSEDGKRTYEIVFDGNKATVHGDFKEQTITIKEECPPCKPKKQKLSFWDHLKLIGGGILILLLGIFIGKLL